MGSVNLNCKLRSQTFLRGTYLHWRPRAELIWPDFSHHDHDSERHLHLDTSQRLQASSIARRGVLQSRRFSCISCTGRR